MRKWMRNLLVGFIGVLVGIVIFLLPFSENTESLQLGVFMYLLGLLVVGIGIGILANTGTIYGLEADD